MTQTSNRFFDEMARLMTDAASVAQGVRREAETVDPGTVRPRRGVNPSWRAWRSVITLTGSSCDRGGGLAPDLKRRPAAGGVASGTPQSDALITHASAFDAGVLDPNDHAHE